MVVDHTSHIGCCRRVRGIPRRLRDSGMTRYEIRYTIRWFSRRNRLPPARPGGLLVILPLAHGECGDRWPARLCKLP
jgi:hypothetical protein